MMSNTAENIIDFPNVRTCTGCNEERNITDFYSSPSHGNRKYQCKKCLAEKNKDFQKKNPDKMNVYRKKWREGNPDKAKESYSSFRRKAHPEKLKNIELKAKYGITLDDVKKMLSSQMGLCGNRGCGKEISIEKKAKNKACVDHDHSTGMVRSLLCFFCNCTLGMLEENKNRILGLTEYLDRHGVAK